MTPAPNSNDPACADVMVMLPASVDGEQRRWTDAQATAAWGDPLAVLLTCGIEPPGPSALPCQEVGGVDWLVDDSRAPQFRFTTYGREPALEVYLEYGSPDEQGTVSGRTTLESLGPAVNRLPETGHVCLDRPTE